MSPRELVSAFLVAAAARDYGTALPMLTDDVEYQNMMLPPVNGPAAVRETMEALMGLTSGSEWVVHQQVAEGELVMNERTDRFRVGERWIDLPVAGVFRVRGDRIAVWHDYFDLQSFMAQLSEDEVAGLGGAG